MNLPLPVIEGVGWLSVFLYVLAYLLLSTNRISSRSYAFHLLNISGASGLILNAIYYSDKANLVVNIIWFCIGATVILRKILTRRKRSNADQ